MNKVLFINRWFTLNKLMYYSLKRYLVKNGYKTLLAGFTIKIMNQTNLLFNKD